MCFSANVSFGAGIALSCAGVLTLKSVKSPSQILFASIPLLFAVQQLSEGFLWLSLSNTGYAAWESACTLTFLFFAQVVWPSFIPISILILEKSPSRKKYLRVLTLTGLTASVYLAWCLKYYPVKAEIESHHIHYILNFPLAFVWASGIFYFLPTVVSPIIASERKVFLLGISILISYIFTHVFYSNYLISVWCFFAAVISAIIYYILTEMNKSDFPAKSNLQAIPE